MLGNPGCSGFEMMDNLENLRVRILYSQNIPIDFQGEIILKWISTDFLRRYENVSAGSP